jgi:hypothetical protein
VAVPVVSAPPALTVKCSGAVPELLSATTLPLASSPTISSST